jgi:transposase-like protein
MPGQRFRIFSREFKEAAVRRILAGERIRAVADDLGLHRQLLYTWLDYYKRGGPDALVPRGRPWKAVALARRQALGQAPSGHPRRRADVEKGEPPPDPRLADLERKVGQQALELDFFKEALRHVKEPPRPSGGRGARASSRSSTR